MKTYPLVALLLIILGGLALVYGGFTYISETHQASIGSLSLTLHDQQWVNTPVWAGIGLIFLGGLMLLYGRFRL